MQPVAREFEIHALDKPFVLTVTDYTKKCAVESKLQ